MKKIKKFAHKMFFKRGSQFVPKPELEHGWKRSELLINEVTLVFLQKKKDDIPAKAIIILAHPYLAEGRLFFIRSGIAQIYLNQNCVVFIPDFNGFGESKFRDFDYQNDLIAVANEVKKKFPDLPVYLHGVSFGASQAIMAASEKTHPFSRIIIENCLDSNLNYYRKRNLKLFHTMRFLMSVFPGINRNHDYALQIQKIHNIQQIIMIYGEDDDLTTVEMGRKLEENSPVNVSFFILPGGHLQGVSKAPAEYEHILNDFIQNQI
ncbi:MAG: alpha/beta hydrolase [Saprospiraceae bacterium]|nr:alpha/beta hydrolase [Saprospiraceae bacterium]